MIATVSRAKMNAILSARPGPVRLLKVTEVNRPALTDDGVLVRVHASSANIADLFPTTRAGYLMGGRKPVVLGNDFAGTVEEVGSAVTQFRPGDEVFGGKIGAFAELIAVPESSAIVPKPAGVSFEQAGTVAVAGTTALQALRRHGRLEPGQRVLVNGASGGVGTFAVQIAHALCGEVTAVCSSANVELVRALGAAAVVDYTKEDFTQGTGGYDLVVDIAGTRSLARCRRVMKPGGTFVGVGAAGVQHARAGLLRAFGHFIGTRLWSMGGTQRVVALFIASLNKEELSALGVLVASGAVKPAIVRRCDLNGIPEALEYLNQGHARAKVAISIP